MEDKSLLDEERLALDASAEAGDSDGDADAESSSGESSRKLNRVAKWCLIVAVVPIVVAIAFVVGRPMYLYAQASACFENGDYARAEELFAEAGSYKDASERMQVAICARLYDEGAAWFEEGEYEKAKGSFVGAGSYRDAPDRVKECENFIAYQAAEGKEKSGSYVEAGLAYAALGDFRDSRDKAASIAGGLFDAQAYEDASKVYAGLGSAFDEQRAKADELKAYADAMGKGDAAAARGEFTSAIEHYSSVPDDFTYKGKNAGAYREQLFLAQHVASTCGKFTSGEPSTMRVVETHDRTGIWNSWDGDCNNSRKTLDIKVSLNGDGSVQVSGKVSFLRYSNFSVISSGLKTSTVTKNFSFSATEPPTYVQIDDETSLSYDGSAWHLSWSIVDHSHDVYFTQSYSAEFTYW